MLSIIYNLYGVNFQLFLRQKRRTVPMLQKSFGFWRKYHTADESDDNMAVLIYHVSLPYQIFIRVRNLWWTYWIFCEYLRDCFRPIRRNGTKPLYQLISQPRKLTHSCRTKIRCALGKKRLRKIKELPLPTVYWKIIFDIVRMSFE